MEAEQLRGAIDAVVRQQEQQDQPGDHDVGRVGAEGQVRR